MNNVINQNDEENREYFRKFYPKKINKMIEDANKKSGIFYLMIFFLMKKAKTYTNEICLSQKQVAKEMGVSEKATSIQFKSLQEFDIIRPMKEKAKYMFNPEIMFYGADAKQINLINKYKNLEKKF